MCGIAGIYKFKSEMLGQLGMLAQRMGDTLAHRGPDSGEIWVNNKAGIALAHRRLAIIDLTRAGTVSYTHLTLPTNREV